MCVVFLVAESTVSSRICSSPSLLHFILSLPLILFLILTAALLYLYVKFRQTNKSPIPSKEERSLWVEMETPEDAMAVYSSHNNECSNNQREEELSKLKEGEMEWELGVVYVVHHYMVWPLQYACFHCITFQWKSQRVTWTGLAGSGNRNLSYSAFCFSICLATHISLCCYLFSIPLRLVLSKGWCYL